MRNVVWIENGFLLTTSATTFRLLVLEILVYNKVSPRTRIHLEFKLEPGVYDKNKHSKSNKTLGEQKETSEHFSDRSFNKTITTSDIFSTYLEADDVLADILSVDFLPPPKSLRPSIECS